MGEEEYKGNETFKTMILGKEMTFWIVDKDFPIREDGIIGINELSRHKFNINNRGLQVDGKHVPFETPEVPAETGEIRCIYTDDGSYLPVYFCNTGKQPLQICNVITTNKQNDTILTQLDKVRLQHVEPELREPLEKIMLHYVDVFNFDENELPCTDLTEHKIVLKQDKIVNTRIYKTPEVHKEEIEKQMKEMREKGIITDSESPYNAPVWVVPKKKDASGKQKWRIVIDFRKLNELTDQDAYPLPDIDDILGQLGDSKYFSALDLSSGFHQIPMAQESRKYTAFSTPQGHYEFQRMPFGLKNAPATFQRMMDTALRGLIGRSCFVYLDDIVIFGRSPEEHNRNLAVVFERLQKLKLKVQPDKCEFLKPELEYLGHVITDNGVKPNPAKTEKIKNFPTPRNVKEVRGFLGLTGYYRKFIKGFATVARPLTELTKKDAEFRLTEKELKAIETLKTKMQEEVVLKYPDQKKQFELTTDASNEGLGAVLSQEGRPCCFVSRTLNPAEKNYTTTEKELLAIVWAIKRLRQYLLGRKFKIITDHKALVWLHNIKDPSSRLMRWRLRLEEYDYKIEYKKGKENTAADALSRIHAVTRYENVKLKLAVDHRGHFEQWEKSPELPKLLKIVPGQPGFKVITKENIGTSPYEWLNKLCEITKLHDKINIGHSDFSEGDRNTLKRYLMYINDKIRPLKLAWELPREYSEEEIQEILEESHDKMGHTGIQKTYERIKERHAIPGLMERIKEWINHCEICQKEKLTRTRRKEEPTIPDTPIESNEKIAMDIFGPLTKTKKGNQFILSVHDELTKYLVLVPLKDQRTETIWNGLLDHYIYVFSTPKKILTDRGQNFVSNLMRKYEEAFKIKHITTTAFHPQSNGSLERTHAVVKDLIKTTMKENETEDWDEQINFINLAYNTTVHDGTGYTPFELTFGHLANLPSAITKGTQRSIRSDIEARKKEWDAKLKHARETLVKNKARYQRDQQRRIRLEQTVFNVKDKVLVHNDHKVHKLDTEWLGPYEITEVHTPYYHVQTNDGTKKIHGNRLKLFTGKPTWK